MARKGLQFSIMFFAASEETMEQDKYRLLLEAAKFADRSGFCSIWLPERHFGSLGGLYPNPSVLHAALAMVTGKIQLRAGSVVLPLHHPIRIAEEWSLVDNLSRGRVGISFASGWNPNDFAFFPEKYEARSEELFRAIPIVKKLWRGQRHTVTNGLGKQVEVQIYPRPLQEDLPVWITAARSPSTFTRAGEAGFNVLTHLLDQDVEDVAKRVALYREARRQNGHDPDAGLVTVMIHTFVGADAETVREQGRKPYCEFLKANAELLKALAASRDRQVDWDSLTPKEADEFVNFLYDRFATTRSLIGTPETCLDLVTRLRAVGVDEIACLLDFGPAYDLVLQNLPHLNRLRELCTSEEFLHFTECQPFFAPAAGEAGNGAGGALKGRLPDEVLTDIQNRCPENIEGREFYNRLQGAGLDVAPDLRGIMRIWRRDGEALGEVELGNAALNEHSDVSPALLDCCLQVSLAALPFDHAFDLTAGDSYVPWKFSQVEFQGDLCGRLFSHVVLSSPVNGLEKSGLPEEIDGELRVFNASGERLASVSGLQLRRPAVAKTVKPYEEEWLYELRWEEAVLNASRDDQETTWMIFADVDGVGHALARSLEARNHRVLVIERDSVLPGPEMDGAPEAFFRSFDRVLRNALAEVAGQRCTVVFLWSIDSVQPEEMTEQSLYLDEISGAGCALVLIQTIAALQGSLLPRVWIATRGGQFVPGDVSPVQLAQAPLWGLGRTCAIEHPELWGGMIDLDPASGNDIQASRIVDAVLAQNGEDQVAFRAEKALVPRVVRGAEFRPARPALRKDASYLITGGLKGIGYEVARWLVRKGARHLCLMGRSPLPPREEWSRLSAGAEGLEEVEKIRSLESSGADVVYATADVANTEQLSSLVKSLADRGLSIAGVIHAASVWRDQQGTTLIRPLAQLDTRSLHEVFRPKVMGSWSLHKAFADTPLDFFVCFSSAASLTGSAAQGNYAAASMFLDALAHYRTQKGLRALSINWGPVSGAGFGASKEGLKVHEYWETNGLKRIRIDQLLGTLEMLLLEPRAQIGVMNIDWDKLASFFPALSQAPWAKYLLSTVASTERSDFAETLARLPKDEQRELLVRLIREQVGEVMALAELPDPRKKLFEMGMDSLMALEVKNRLQKKLGTDIRVTAIFNYPTIHALAEYVVKDVLPAVALKAIPKPPAETEPKAGVQPEDTMLSRIKSMSEEEVGRLLEFEEGKLNPLP